MKNLVLLLSELRYLGKESGVDSTSPAGHLVRFRERKIVYMQAFRNQAGAIKAAGLSE